MLASCADAEGSVSAPKSISAAKQEQSAALTDKKLLYKNDESALEVKTLYLTVRRGNESENTNHSWGEINSYSVFDYERMGADRYKVEAVLQEGDENGPYAGGFGYGLTTPNSTVQIRGQTSSKYAQKNYKIEIKKDAGSLDGKTTIALNKHMFDSLRLRNKLCFDLMSQIPEMLSLQTQFVHLYVKDETREASDAFTDYGLYTQVEQLNKTALAAHGMDSNGQLYKVNYFEFFRYENVIKLKSDETYDKKAFEELLEIKGNDDHSKLMEMLDDVNNYTIPIQNVCEKYFDMDNMLTWMAFHILMGNIDTQSRNVYLYSPLNSGKWYFWSWDNDGALEQTTKRVRGNPTARGWEYGISNYWGNVLFNRVLKNEAYRRALAERIDSLYSGVLSPENVQAMAEKYAAVTTPYIFSEPDINYSPVTQTQHDEILSLTGQEVADNYKAYKEGLDCPMPFYIGSPEKTDDGEVIGWDASYDLKDRDITYTAMISDSVNFDNILAQYTGALTEIKLPELKTGQYFIKVTCKNTSGKTQTAFDYYYTQDSQKLYGIKCFYVLPSGVIKEAEYDA